MMARGLHKQPGGDPPGTRHFRWWFPGVPVQVCIDLPVVDKISDQLLKNRGSSTGGLLLGDSTGETVHIQAALGLAELDAASVSASLEGIADGGEALGFYATCDGALRLNDDHIALTKQFFPPPKSVVLLAQVTNGDLPRATFFFWDGGELFNECALMEFPLDAARLETEQHPAVLASVPAKLREPLELPRPAGSAPIRRRRVSFRTLLLVGAWTALAGTGATALWLSGLRRAPEKATIALPVTRSRIDLRVERSGPDVRLTWDRDSPAITSAVSGKLSIQDDRRRRDVLLDVDQLRNGTILYEPAGGQIEISLSVATADNRTTTESALLILPVLPAPAVATGQAQRVAIPKDLADTRDLQAAHVKLQTGLSIPDHRLPDKPVNVEPPVRERQIERIPTAVAEPVQPLAIDSPKLGDLPSRSKPPDPLMSAIPALQALQAPEPHAASVDPGPHPREVVPSADPIIPTAENKLPVVGPEVLRKAAPRITPELRVLLTRNSTIAIRVHIGSNGDVRSADIVHQPGAYTLLEAAAASAAMNWRFRPARRGDFNIPSEMLIYFRFERDH